MSVIIDIADAVVAALNAATLTKTFTAARAYAAVYDIRTLADLKVTVVPVGVAISEFDLAPRHRYEVDIGVWIQCRTDTTTTTTDPYMNLAEEIIDLFRGDRLIGYRNARCFSVENRPLYLPDQVDSQRVFTTVVTLTFRLTR
jgi:hypothetical protein